MADAENFGHYFGRLILQPLPDGRLMRVVEPFGFEERSSRRWPVPVDTKVDGASIPQALWSLIGGPFEGKYRDASVVHDYYCDVRTEPWEAVHRVFYNAMRASGASEARAKLMYAAVRFAGPRWSDTVVDNTNLPRPESAWELNSLEWEREFDFTEHTKFEEGVLDVLTTGNRSAREIISDAKLTYGKGPKTELHVEPLSDLIASQNPSLDEIDKALEETVERITGKRGQNRPRALVDLPPTTGT